MRLLTDDDEWVPEAKTALLEVFDRFDIDKDDALSEKELDAFASACNGRPFDSASKADIIENFEVTKAGFLTREGFMQMFHLQTQADEKETLRDLMKLGYDRRLQLKTKP